MNPTEAREKVGRFYRLATGRSRIAEAEHDLGIQLHVAIKDDDLIVIFAEHLHLARALAPPGGAGSRQHE